jgi:hypothetical protein
MTEPLAPLFFSLALRNSPIRVMASILMAFADAGGGEGGRLRSRNRFTLVTGFLGRPTADVFLGRLQELAHQNPARGLMAIKRVIHT